MSRWAWCVEGRHEGTKPKHSKTCPGGPQGCSCECHKPKTSRFARREKVGSRDDQSATD